MRIDIPQEAVRLLLSMTPEERREWLSKCSPETILLIDAAFEAWSAKGQIAPTAEGWRVWLMMAGRGFGKTRAGAEWIYRLGWSRPVRIALVAASIDEARAVDGRRGQRPAEGRQAAAPQADMGTEPGAADVAARERRPTLFGRSSRRAEGPRASFRLVLCNCSMSS